VCREPEGSRRQFINGSEAGVVIPLEKALTIVQDALAGHPLRSQRLPIVEAQGRFLREDVVSQLDIPPFDRVVMDGYAVVEGETGRRLRVVAEVQAGQVTDVLVRPGTAVKIMTGAPAPAGTGKVVMVEKTRRAGGHVEILAAETERHVTSQGEDLKAGDVIARRGERLDEVRIAGLAACGITDVQVGRRPRVAVLVTGDELVERPGERTGGRIFNANGPLLVGLLRSYGYAVRQAPVVRDDPGETAARIAAAMAANEMVVLTGGVSAGEYDYVPQALETCGLRILFSRVAVKPGKPVTFAVQSPAAGTVAFGLPGNPVSVFVTAHLFVLPALALLEGGRRPPRLLQVPLAASHSFRPSPRVQFLPARLDHKGRVVPLPYHGSGHLHALANAEGLLRLEPGAADIPAGAPLPFWPVRLPAFAAEGNGSAFPGEVKR
jgi:molybdopterin molybdotransferase